MTNKIIAFPHPPGSGGPGNFQLRLERFLKDHQWTITYADSNLKPDLVVIVGGTRRIGWLLKMKYHKVPIIYRLDGILWLHRKIKVPFKKYLLAEYRNWNNKLIHAFIADQIVYQSDFVQKWWEKKGWRIRNSFTIIHNGIDTNIFCPTSSENPVRLVCLEGTVDYSPYVMSLLNNLRLLLPDNIIMDLFGRFEDQDLQKTINPGINYYGKISRDEVQGVFQNAIYLSLDIHPACPNAVVEALACGAPVVAFDTGSLSELVHPEAGLVVPFGSDPWELGYPDDMALCNAILKIFHNFQDYSRGARSHAEKNFNKDKIFNSYLKLINSNINH